MPREANYTYSRHFDVLAFSNSANSIVQTLSVITFTLRFPDEKFGLCPKLPASGSLKGDCQDTCRYDSQCADNTKCCNNGCASVCLAPRKPDCETTQCRVGFKCTQRRTGAPYCAAIREFLVGECSAAKCTGEYLTRLCFLVNVRSLISFLGSSVAVWCLYF